MRLPIQNDNLQGLDLNTMLPNPDKFDYADPDHMVINPKSDYYHVPNLKKVRSKLGAKSISSLHCNIRNISKNIGPLEDMFYSLREQPDYDVIGVTETRLNESYSGQRKRKSVWLCFQSKICELVSGKLT